MAARSRMALAKNDEQMAFRTAYGEQGRSPAALWRARIYAVRHLGSVRLEHHQLGNTEGVQKSYGCSSSEGQAGHGDRSFKGLLEREHPDHRATYGADGR
ncbi:hypothetical protein GCM10010329_78990 [Streptomyces spiroverticillatus]|uniref:Uncharacterized protein n=1 Tax=Streptomyces finlayi TaxID=67296 RepID=A0A918X8I4_9ACTN|nr:hypothetical protein GCM10010329_78990 [Streptomyces spiroverticillatus]GHD17825.1 hypothetical protein GCM10010334_79970 [Streptomyces finlayi]